MPADATFAGRTVLVTGAAQGIGAAIANAFLDRQATVFVADLDAEGIEPWSSDPQVAAYCVDLADDEATRAMIGTIIDTHGTLDILIHAAGGVRDQVGKPVEQVSIDDWRSLFEANVDSLFCLARAVAPAMKKRGSGRIITISSGAGLRPSLTGIQAYAAAKHALVGLTRQLSQELGPFGITVNSIAPGLVLSNPSTRKQWASYSRARQQEIIEATHMRRLGEPEDIAAAALYFADPAAGWVTGQVLSVDGGRS